MARNASNLQIDSVRLWDTIHETAKFGLTPKGGVRRLTLGPEDKQVRDWFRKACEAAGLEVHVDGLGSMFGVRKGRDNSKPPVGLGSHLDTQPTGGKFDGVLGTLAALEVVRTLNDAGIETEVPLCICNWTNEEGSRFAPATMASAAYAGEYTTDNILARKDAAGMTVGEALDGIGYRGSEPVGKRKFGAFVELHIEQGPLLEAENKTIGVVDRGQGIIWYDGKIVGFESHAGTTPMPLRRDALATLSEIVLAVESIAKKHGPHAVGTVGEAVIAAPSRNVIPGEIAFTVDVRSPEVDDAGCDRRRFARGDCRHRAAAKSADRTDGDLAQTADDFRRQNWSMPSRRPRRCWATAIAASPRAPATMPAISPPWFRPRWCSCPVRTASATTSWRTRRNSTAPRAATCCCTPCWRWPASRRNDKNKGRLSCVEFSSTPMIHSRRFSSASASPAIPM